MKKSARGFSLLEMIGVMAVMAILAGALVPSVFQLIEEGYQAAEKESMAAIAGSLRSHIVQNKSIPTSDSRTWATAVAEYAAMAPIRVLKNDKGFTRVLYFDPRFFTSVDSRFGGYNQTLGLATKPVSPRLMIISSLSGEVSANLSSAEAFSQVWDQGPKLLIEESKSLFIERVNLGSLFLRVVLNNAHKSQVGYVLEDGSEGPVAGISGAADGSRTVWVLAGTALSLNVAPYPGGITQRQTIISVARSMRYQFDGSDWYWVG